MAFPLISKCGFALMLSFPHPYPGREVSLATRHGKERAMARPFPSALGWELQLAAAFDTASLGTFSGEVPRPAGPAETCRLKALGGLETPALFWRCCADPIERPRGDGVTAADPDQCPLCNP
ncbi:MAG: hypothetical protein VKI81_05340 [Synechococcaceae cyanobacterium]|nr:hypothetical protein [Synechococcaceae cyanobacterium]